MQPKIIRRLKKIRMQNSFAFPKINKTKKKEIFNDHLNQHFFYHSLDPYTVRMKVNEN